MMHRAILMGAIAMLFVLGTNARAVQLVPNWDFEILAVDEEGQPVLDSIGNEVPAFWFRDPNVTNGTPHTELISPNNMNNAAGDNTGDDSTGTGTNSAALNAVTMEIAPGLVIGIPTDWRSQGVATTPGETLIFSFDFKFIDVNDKDPTGFDDEGFMAQIRSFSDVDEGGGTAGSFEGEISPTIFAQNYANDEWHHISFQYSVPAGGNYADIRLSANIFPPATLSTGQVLLDKVGIHRLTADFDGDIVVDGQDFEIWETNFGLVNGATKELGDADGDGIVDGFDFLAWQREFGIGVGAIPHNTVAAISQIPEPSSFILVLCGALGMLCGRRASV